MKDKEQDWHYCHACQMKRGGETPKNQGPITVSKGKCSMCKKDKQTLIPNMDYNWPKKGQKAWFD